MKLVIVGSGGRLGAALLRIYGTEHEIIGFNHREIELGSNEAITQKLEPVSFDVLINCAALTNVDYCETHEAEALQVNAHAVRRLAEICRQKNARCLHISTDYVFDGKKETPYVESDAANPISIYGESKRRGEIELLDVSEKNLAVRASWLFGPDRPSFIDMVLNRALECEQVEAIGDKFSTPSFSLDFAHLLAPFLRDIDTGGLLHLCNAGDCSWQQYGQFALDCGIDAGLPMKAKIVGTLKLDEMKSFIAKRPINTALSVEKLTQLTGEKPRTWQAAVEDYVTNHFAPAHW